MTMIYRVTYRHFIEATEEIKNQIDMQSEGKIDVDNIEDISETRYFEIGAENYMQAVLRANNMLYDMFSENNDNDNNDSNKNNNLEFEILAIDNLKDKDGEPYEILNWGEEEHNCEDCKDSPYCEFQGSAPDDQITFTCPNCNFKIEVADGWEELSCKECGYLFNRNKLKEISGVWIYNKIEKKKKDIKKKLDSGSEGDNNKLNV